ncbi:MAG TPA: MlaD family protein [Spongiibacteraceae bacterium]
MSRSANPVTVGAFVLGILVLAFLLVLFFSGGNWFSKRDRYVLVYDSSIKGLNIGAPVTLKGVKIGQVTDIKARMYNSSLSIFNNVTIEINPKMLEREDVHESGGVLVDEMVERGLSAQLRLQSLLTGLLYVDVDFHPDRPGQLKDVATAYKQIPTTPTDLEQLTHDLESIDVNKLGENLQQIVSGVNSFVNDQSLQNTMKNIEQTLQAVRTSADAVHASADSVGAAIVPLAQHGDATIAELNRSLPALMSKLDTTMTALQQTAASLQKTSANATYLTSEDSPLLYRVESAAASVNSAAEQVRRLTETLEHQPESLLYGKLEK